MNRDPQDAVVWRRRATQLLPLAPTDWISNVVTGWRQDVHDYRRANGGYEPEIRLQHPRQGLSLIRTVDEVDFHVDLDCPRYSYLLIIRSRHHMVEGGMWSEPFRPDAPGDLIALDVHMMHALRPRAAEGPEDLQSAIYRDESVVIHPWAAIAMDSWCLMPPEQAIIAYTTALSFDRAAAIKAAHPERI